MKKAFSIFFSSKTTLVLLVIFMIAIIAATFIENYYDTTTAKIIVYNATWFEVLLSLLAVNFLGSINKYQFFRWDKIPGFIFHFSFVVMILGAFITRYYGYEAEMTIREGTSSSNIYSDKTYLQIRVNDGENETFTSKPLMLGMITDNSFQIDLETSQREPITVYYKGYLKNAVEQYQVNDTDDNLGGALILTVTYKDQQKELTVFGGPGQKENFQSFEIDGVELQLSYGAKKIALPFAIHLNNFELKKYPGSNNPSTIESDVTLIDQRNGHQINHKIFVNNILDYDGYRFFQMSYDEDEKGTILAVNYDFWGTWITYFGYFLFLIGVLINFFNKQTRFWNVVFIINQLRKKRELLLLLILSLFSNSIFAQSPIQSNQNSQNTIPNNSNWVSAEHADKFGELIVQTYEGRFAPVHTLATDVMHKISKKDRFDIPNRGAISAVQVFMDILLNPDFWRYQKVIYIGDKAIADLLGITGKHAALNDLFIDNGQYKLGNLNAIAFRKPDSKRNRFDRELLKFTERAEVFMMISRGSLLTLFPVPNDPNNKWISWDNEWALRPIASELSSINNELKLIEFNYTNLMSLYLQETYNATFTGNYTNAEKLIDHIKSIQRQEAFSEHLPSPSKVKKEITYNKLTIFDNLKITYALLSILLLIAVFTGNLIARKSKMLSMVSNAIIVLIIAAFIYQTYGIGLRWYLAGHAPLSNGYEVLLLASWSSVFAGLCFMRYSKIVLSGAAMLSFFILLTAKLSNYDPQITVLQPGMKSDWLIYHVTTLTISYGFFGLAFLLSLFNMIIYLVKTPYNKERLTIITGEITYINELILIIGLYLVTIGTFLGAIWANELWGRYWGWDPKETWSLVIIIFYTILLHIRLIPKFKSEFIFNVGTIVGITTVLMTFFGISFYFSKGMHTYTVRDTPVFPLWLIITIVLIVMLIVVAAIKENKKNKVKNS